MAKTKTRVPSRPNKLSIQPMKEEVAEEQSKMTAKMTTNVCKTSLFLGSVSESKSEIKNWVRKT